jgi:hypothetical protein
MRSDFQKGGKMTTSELDKRQKISGGEPISAPPPAVRSGTARFGRRKKGNQGRKTGKEFIDHVDEAYTDQISMSAWREVEAVLKASASLEAGIGQLRSLGDFKDRGEYAPIWRKNWEEAVGLVELAADYPQRLGIVREAVTKSVNEENEARALAGQPPVVDEEEGQQFIDYAIGRIIDEADGEIEDDL